MLRQSRSPDGLRDQKTSISDWACLTCPLPYCCPHFVFTEGLVSAGLEERIPEEMRLCRTPQLQKKFQFLLLFSLPPALELGLQRAHPESLSQIPLLPKRRVRSPKAETRIVDKTQSCLFGSEI